MRGVLEIDKPLAVPTVWYIPVRDTGRAPTVRQGPRKCAFVHREWLVRILFVRSMTTLDNKITAVKCGAR